MGKGHWCKHEALVRVAIEGEAWMSIMGAEKVVTPMLLRDRSQPYSRLILDVFLRC